MSGTRSQTQARLDDLNDLLDWGESPHQIPARLGTTPGALAKWLYRHEHRDLAAVFARIEKRSRAA